jgi:Ca2+:H+ antiporter
LYSLGLVFGFKNENHSLASDTVDQDKSSEEQILPEKEKIKTKHTWSVKTALIILAISTTLVAILSELLVGSVEPIVLNFGISEFFIGIILIPIIGNIAEHLVAVKVAIADHMELSVQIANASSLQIALFVAPLLVFISLIIGNPLVLIFNIFELLALITGVLIAALVSADGESNWLEGAELLAVYFIWALAFYLLPL